MSIIRTARKRNFTTIDNQVFQENQLSFQAMGMLSFLLSKPDNWTINMTHLAGVTKRTAKVTGRDGVYAILRELKSAGFVTFKRHSSGKVDYLVYDQPCQIEPEPANTDEERPDTSNPDQANPDLANTTLINTDNKQELNGTNSNVELDHYQRLAQAVIQYLNTAARRKFSTTAKSTTQNIIARLKDGASLADCQAVIDFKTQEWGQNAQMSQYLRPNTLFSESKFPAYLGAAQAVRSGHAQTTTSNALESAAQNLERLQNRFRDRQASRASDAIGIDGPGTAISDSLASVESAIPS